ncbi:MAG: hypothetical protein IKG22_10115 [Atopobiaceae bacterium]|nr:hypothetical protein [Atopobiaceae bacterium]
MRPSYATDFDLAHDIFRSEMAIGRIARKFGIEEDEAARNILTDEEYDRWAAGRTASEGTATNA